MDESLFQRTFGGRIGLRRQSHQTFRELVSFQRFEAGDYDVDSHVVLVPTEEVRLGQVLLNKEARSLIYRLLSTNHSNSATAAGPCWFHDVHVSIIGDLSVSAPPFLSLIHI